MRKLLTIALILALLAPAHGSGIAYVASACGLNKAFRALCGNNQTTSPPASPSHIAGGSTPVTLGAGGNYILDGNLNCGLTVFCITANNTNTVIYLNNFTLTGIIRCQFNCAGLEVYGGTVNCAVLDSTSLGCMPINETDAVSPTTLSFHDLTGTNSVDASGNNSARWLHFDVSTASSATTIVLNHLDGAMTNATDASTTRAPIVNITGNDLVAVEIKNSKFNCGPVTATCQGAQLYGAHGRVHNNYGNMQQNTSAGDSDRFMAFDGNATVPSEVDSNDVDANNNRFLRARNIVHLRAHDNWVWNANSPGGLNATATFHFGDPDTGDNLNMDIWVMNNNIELQGTAVGLMARDEIGVTVKDNNVTCSGSCAGGAGTFAYLRDPSGNGAPTGVNTLVTLMHNRGVTGLGLTAAITVSTGAVLSYCDTGTPTGSGTATPITCP